LPLLLYNVDSKVLSGPFVARSKASTCQKEAWHSKFPCQVQTAAIQNTSVHSAKLKCQWERGASCVGHLGTNSMHVCWIWCGSRSLPSSSNEKTQRKSSLALLKEVKCALLRRVIKTNCTTHPSHRVDVFVYVIVILLCMGVSVLLFQEMYRYIHVHTYTKPCPQTQTSTHTNTYAYIRTYIRVHTYIHADSHAHMHTHSLSHTHTRMHAHIHTLLEAPSGVSVFSFARLDFLCDRKYPATGHTHKLYIHETVTHFRSDLLGRFLM